MGRFLGSIDRETDIAALIAPEGPSPHHNYLEVHPMRRSICLDRSYKWSVETLIRIGAGRCVKTSIAAVLVTAGSRSKGSMPATGLGVAVM